MKPLQLQNSRFGYLTVLKRQGSRWGKSLWLCQCDCGNLCERTAAQLKLNENPSCGCMTSLTQSQAYSTHGQTHTRLYRIWKNMKQRCYNEKIPYYHYYGGKGIKVCSEWLDSFENFYNWSLSNGYTDELTIDRIDGDGNYEPNNCRWVDMFVQNRNKRRVQK